VVLTGGGSLLDGIAELGEFVFDMPVRKAEPHGFGGLADVARSAQFSTAVGLLFYADKISKDDKFKLGGNSMGQLMARVKNLVDSVF
jgi:cell division protein FtsA